jgi:hypothetical protein
MERRITTETVIFRHPFRLAGFEHEEAPGVYTLEIEEEALDTLSVIGWRHIATILKLRRLGATECVVIDPVEFRQVREWDRDPDRADFL